MDKLAKLIKDIATELEFQDETWGAKRTIDLPTRYLILSEEVGEVAQGMLNLTSMPRAEGTLREVMRRALRYELVQVAAVTIETILSMDEGRAPDAPQTDA